MSSETLTFDPDGDLILIFNSPQEDAKTPDSKIEDLKATQGGKLFSTGDCKRKSPKAIRMLASSKHLMLASPVFKAMLKLGVFREGTSLQVAGKAEVPLPDDSAAAFEILLNIIHGRVRQIPMTISIELMTEIAIIIDKYQITEAVGICAHYLWLPPLLAKANFKTYNEHTPAWLCISWVFGLSEAFKEITRTIQFNATGAQIQAFLSPEPMSQVLPIPDRVIEALKRTRYAAITIALSAVHSQIQTYQSSITNCTTKTGRNVYERQRACDGMLLGTLLKSTSENLLWPPPVGPYTEFDHLSILGFFDMIRGLKVYSLCENENNFKGWGVEKYWGSHGGKEQLGWKLIDIESKLLIGLELEEVVVGEGRKSSSMRDT